MGLTENARITLDGVVKYIEGDGLEQFVEKNLFLRSMNIEVPAMKWSSLNKMAVLARTKNLDCRGFDQWNKAGRRVKKGARSAFILVPVTVKKPKEGEPEAEQVSKLIGFRCCPVFASDQTEGEPLPYEAGTESGFSIDKLPLKAVADHLGVKVCPGLTTNAYGFFRPDTKQIVLGTDDITTWFHELGHAIDNEIEGKSEDYAFNEVVAELTSSTLCKTLGYKGHLEHTKAYIKEYKGKAHVAFTLSHAVDRVIKIYEYIAGFMKGPPIEKVA
ncbi:MAG: zincin-like metallopeptidase domain-containing protein [Spirochaetales bacterium]